MRAAYNMAEAVVWLHEQCTNVSVCACVRGRQVHVCCRPARRCCRPGATVLSAGGTVLSAECGIGGERLGVDVDRPVGRLDYSFVVVGCSDCEFRCSV